MHKKEQVLHGLLEQRILPLYYHENAEKSRCILQALYTAGIRQVEYINRGENALENFKILKRAAGQHMPDLLLGIGTIKTRDVAQQFIEAGADFIVCPVINTEIAKLTKEAGLLWIPGCMTPTEISVAEDAGASLVKIFPANVLGPSYISAIGELFPRLRFLPTGGVEAGERNLKNWFGAGAAAVGLGSKLISKECVQQEDYERLIRTVQQALCTVKHLTGKCRIDAHFPNVK